MKSPSAVDGSQSPLRLAPGGVVDQHAFGRRVDVLELADLAMEGDVRQRQLKSIAGGRDHLVPAQHALDAILACSRRAAAC